MPRASSREVSRHLNTLFHCGAAGQLGDEQLLDRFVTGRDEAAEAAFAALMDRHGAMVLGVCRRVLGNREAAEDAFQATFLVLARKAGTIARREHLSRWLYGVALRAAMEARARATRQQAREKRLAAMRPIASPDQADTSELRVIVDEELARLPDRYRSAVILCELEGLSRREAAGRLGVAEGTLSSRLARAKARLKDRLTRRGVALSAATLASFLAREAHAVIVPPALAEATIRVAALAAAGSSTAGVVSASVATLTQGVLKAMLLAKFKGIALGLVTLTLVTTGMTAVAQIGGDVGHEPRFARRSDQSRGTEARQAPGSPGRLGPCLDAIALRRHRRRCRGPKSLQPCPCRPCRPCHPRARAARRAARCLRTQGGHSSLQGPHHPLRWRSSSIGSDEPERRGALTLRRVRTQHPIVSSPWSGGSMTLSAGLARWSAGLTGPIRGRSTPRIRRSPFQVRRSIAFAITPNPDAALRNLQPNRRPR